jgi:hypothetical protein
LSLFQLIFFRFINFQVVVDVEGGEEVKHGETIEEAPEAEVVMPEPDARVDHVDAKLEVNEISNISSSIKYQALVAQ